MNRDEPGRSLIEAATPAPAMMPSVLTDLAAGSVLAFDFGSRRIGVAVAEPSLGIAHPLAAITFADNRRRFDAITALIEEWRPTRLIVGCPQGNDDAAQHDAGHPLATPIRRFARRLEGRFALPVTVVDEHLSSWEASRKLTQAGVPARAQKPILDSMAACTILEIWLAERPLGANVPGEGP